MKNSADSNDEKDYETDEEALGMIKFKTSKSNFQFSIYKISWNNFNLHSFEIVCLAVVHVSVSGTLQEDLRNLKPNEFSFIDVSSEKPLVVIGNQIFSGEYQVCKVMTVT